MGLVFGLPEPVPSAHAAAGAESGTPSPPTFEHAPLLAILAASAAFLDLAFARVLLRVLDIAEKQSLVTGALRFMEFPQNVAVIAGLIAVVTSFIAFVGQPLSPAEQASVALTVFRRVSLAAFAIVFAFIITATTFLPAHHTVRAIVLLAISSGSVLSLLVVLHGVSQPGPRAIRVGLALLGAGSGLSLLSLVVSQVLEQAGTTVRLPADVLFQIGETSHLIAPIPIATSLIVAPLLRTPRSYRSPIIGLLAAALIFAVLVIGYTTLRAEDFPNLLYAAQRVEVLLTDAPMLVLLLVALPIGAALAGLVSGSPESMQSGAGLLLIASAGYAPPSAARALWSLLGVILLTRSSLAAGSRLMNLRRDDSQLRASETNLS